ncbi:hypothetical protein LH426_07855 [Laribacter hongkongensis]|jgi:hypothetical protein|uniref:hypothetical protein n=1 Tax=Laribacter hongkongensis TaxID=168471 RepID=UPI001EFC8DD6|nr:hypothetical protein [Laribacter hongkongensis]MCG9004394.1 hypothetical protein [Laribacter hongkongensis]MCG9042448.1 hypothetical protein [Laribacter hongkongensis]
MTTWQQKKIGRDLVAASEQLAQAKRIGNAGGTLAQGISADLQAAARRKVANLVDLAAKYHSSKPTIAKDEAPAVTWAEISAAALSLTDEDWSRFTSQREILDRLIEIAEQTRSAKK